MRSFALDAITHAEVLNQTALDVPESELDAVFTVGYGIFSGGNLSWATLQFSPDKARWVSKESWHPQQQSHFDADGNYILTFPYSDDRELVMDILRHVPEVTVLEPVALRDRVMFMLEEGIARMKSAIK